jgi:hypothetical protein
MEQVLPRLDPRRAVLVHQGPDRGGCERCTPPSPAACSLSSAMLLLGLALRAAGPHHRCCRHVRSPCNLRHVVRRWAASSFTQPHTHFHIHTQQWLFSSLPDVSHEKRSDLPRQARDKRKERSPKPSACFCWNWLMRRGSLVGNLEVKWRLLLLRCSVHMGAK